MGYDVRVAASKTKKTRRSTRANWGVKGRAAKQEDKESALEPALAFMRELWALDHALGSTSKRMLDRMGITAQQRMVLRFVGKYPRIGAKELAAMLHVEKGTLSLALKRLEERGLIVRHREMTDARRTLIVLTPQGQSFDRPTVGTVELSVERVLASTRPRDVNVIRSFLQRLVVELETQERS